MQDIDAVACASDFDLVAVRSGGVPGFWVGVDDAVASGYQHPAWFGSPRGSGDDGSEIVSFVQHFGMRHEYGLLGRQVGHAAEW
jgi:hypothetical protein